MSKKNFSGGLNSLLGAQSSETITTDQPAKRRPGRPQTNFRQITKTSQKGTQENETRATFIVEEDSLEKIKAIAYWDRLSIKDTINNALNEAVKRWEAKNGTVKPIPKK
jgi:hypothetical protein